MLASAQMNCHAPAAEPWRFATCSITHYLASSGMVFSVGFVLGSADTASLCCMAGCAAAAANIVVKLSAFGMRQCVIVFWSRHGNLELLQHTVERSFTALHLSQCCVTVLLLPSELLRARHGLHCTRCSHADTSAKMFLQYMKADDHA